MTTFPQGAVELLGQRVVAIVTTLLSNGDPHSVVAGVALDGDQLVSHTGPGARRLQNLRADPRINIVAVDPRNPMRYLEVRGTATLREISGEQHMQARFKEHAERYDLPPEAGEIPEGIEVVQIRVTPQRVNYFDLQRSQMGPATKQRRTGNAP